MRTLLTALTAIALLAIIPGATADQTEPGRALSPRVQAASGITDAEQFIVLATLSNLFEIESSELALERSQDAGTRAFAQQMIADHTAQDQRMRATALAANLGNAIPNELDTAHVQRLGDVQSASNFDEAYIRAQVEAHDIAIALFTSYAENGDNPVLQQFAARELPILTQHRAGLPAGPSSQHEEHELPGTH